MSKSNQKVSFYLSKNRYLELKYFCKQYEYWQYLVTNPDKIPNNICEDDLKNAIYMVEKTAYSTNCEFVPMLLHKVTRGGSYESLVEKYPIDPPSKEEFVDAYKKFFYFLSKEKGI